MSKITHFFSGSEGNATLISSCGTNILIDAGVSCKRLVAALNENGTAPQDLSAICITHGHEDHVRGLKVFLKHYDIPVFASAATLDDLAARDILNQNNRVICADEGDFACNNILVTRFATSHDSLGSGGYVFTASDGIKAALCTDLGVITPQVHNALLGCKVVLIESNHDVNMLKNGPYPPQLKMRILSDIGHLSNNTCASEIKELLKGGATHFILGHLSRQNNTPDLAFKTTKAALLEMGAKLGIDYDLSVAGPNISGGKAF